MTILFKILLCTHALHWQAFVEHCARHDVTLVTWSWPSGFYSLLEKWIISQNITVHSDTPQ